MPARCPLNRSTLWEVAGTRVGWFQQLVSFTGAERLTCSRAQRGHLEASPSAPIPAPPCLSTHGCGGEPGAHTLMRHLGAEHLARQTPDYPIPALGCKKQAGILEDAPATTTPPSSVRSCPAPLHIWTLLSAPAPQGGGADTAPAPQIHQGSGRRGTPNPSVPHRAPLGPPVGAGHRGPLPGSVTQSGGEPRAAGKRRRCCHASPRLRTGRLVPRALAPALPRPRSAAVPRLVPEPPCSCPTGPAG